jgi:chromosome segregation ATPase/SAM-dependent methyltransferase
MSGLSLIDVWYRRLPRYLFIEDRLRDQPVLELGCGSGLGADFLIEQGAGRVVGVDADERQILRARARYKRPNLSFEVSAGAELPFGDGEFGVVLIPEGSQAIQDGELLAAVRRVLRPDGLCLLAAPNGDLEEPDPEGLSYYDMIESLEPVFPSVTMVAQTPMLAFTFVDFVASAEELDVGLDDSLAQDLVDDVAYYVALCSVEPCSPQVFAITQVPFAPVARRVQHLLDGQPPEQLELGDLQEALAAEREERIRLADVSGDLELELLERQNTMGELRARLAEADELQVAVEARLEPLQAELADATRAAEALRETAEELERERDGLRDQAERYVKRAEATEQELEVARREAGELQQRAESNSAALSELDSLHAAEEQLRQRAEARQREMDEVRGELEQGGHRMVELEQELGEVRGAAEQGGHRIVELERELGEVRDQAEGRAHRIVELERELGEARGAAEQRGQRIGELEQELAQAHEAIDQRSHRVGELERALDEARADAEQRDHRIGELERALDEARGGAEQRNHRIGEQERALDEAREKAAQRKQRTGELKREVELAQGQADGFRVRIGELDQALDALRAEAGRQRDQAVARIEQLREQIAEAETALGAALQQCSALEERLAAEQERVADLQAEARRSQQQLESTQKSLAEALDEHTDSGQRIEAMEVGLDASRGEVRSLTATAAQAQQAAADLEEELRSALERVSGLEEQLARTSEQAGASAADLQRIQQQLLAVDEQGVAMEGRLRDLQLELATAQADRRSLEVRLEQALIRADQSEVTGVEDFERREDLESRLITELEDARQELNAARHQAAEQTAEAARWQELSEKTRQELQQSREQAAALEAARKAVDSDDAVGRLRTELEAARAQGIALGAEHARLLREASLAEDAQASVAQRLEAAEQTHEATARGMELVIARLESERERADGLDREVRELRERNEERGEIAVNVTREAAAEAQRAQRYRRELVEATAQAESLRAELDRRTAELQQAREHLEAPAAPEPATRDAGAELAPLIRRLEQRTTALQEAQACIRELGDQVSVLTAEQQELRRAHATVAQAGQSVSDWDAEIQQGQVRALEAQQAELLADLEDRERARRALEARLQHQAERVQELLAGAERHRLEMADREIAQAEQAAWNTELAAAGDRTSQELASARQVQQRCEARLADAQSGAQQLGAEIARLQGALKRREAELEELRTAQAAAVDTAENERAMEAAVQEAAVFKQQLEDAKQTLFERKDRIEELEALLDLAKVARGRAKDSAKKRETLIGIGPETQEIPPYEPQADAPQMDLVALRAALDEVGELEKTCLMEEERIGVLATSLARLNELAGTMQEQFLSERLKLAEVEQQRRDLASQASRVPELELEIDVLRTQSATGSGAEQVERAELFERLLKEQKILAEDAARRCEIRITELNNTIGDKDAEILLMHASVESMQRRARQLAANIQEALGGAIPPTGGSAQVLLDRVKAELEGLMR